MTWTERDLIELLGDKIDHSTNILGHDEDAVAIRIGDQYLVINIDGWVASTDRPKGMTLYNAAKRAVANSLSDVYAKGAKPLGMSISLSLPNGMDLYPPEKADDPFDLKNLTEIKDLARKLLSTDDIVQDSVMDIVNGISDASKKYDIPYLGGDINSSKDLIIDVTSWGLTDTLFRRDSATVGEKVCWLGPPLGSTAAALGILTKDWKGNRSKALQIMGEPDLFPKILDIDVNAAIDCSDGLARTLHLLADASHIGINLTGNIHLDDWVNKIARINGKKITDLVFFGGEELGIVFTCSADTELPDNAIILGEIIEENVVTIGDDTIPDIGWEHFSSSSLRI